MGLFKLKNKQMEILQKMQENLEKSEQNIVAFSEMIGVSSEGKGNSNVFALEKITDRLDDMQTTQEALFEKIFSNEESTEQANATMDEMVTVLKQTQENLLISQNSTESLATVINQLTEKKEPEKENIDKFKAAYALNLCTVSVSQIIDYNDIYFLEQEYEAILNNLNLEEMPKDEELLNILKQILDVITYFRIQEGDKKMMEKEYQHKMKNAIWNAVPNFGLVVASADPWAMAVSLASQIGIGYMNYRREKAENALEREKQEWELQRSAMEQFNGLRRELFDTAWRLAEKYNFDDEYRLTERQITQYNEILMDPDYLRRYERLEYISDKFEAYPPFWYYFGNAANQIAQDESMDDDIRNRHKENAIKHFVKFIKNTENNLLREDQLLAAGALELFDIIDEDNLKEVGISESLDKYKEDLLEKVVKASGNAYDVLQLCALSYLKIDKTEKASRILKMLVNADYNKIVNAQLLSQIYVSNYINDGSKEAKEKYEILQQRISPQYLIPMPDSKADGKIAEQEFLDAQKENLLYKYALVIENFIEKYEYSHDILNKDATLKQITEVYQSICILPCIMENDKENFYQVIAENIQENKNEFDEENSHEFNIIFKKIFEKVFEDIAGNIEKKIKGLNELSDISDIELKLKDFCIKAKIDEPVLIFDDTHNLSTNVERIFDESILFEGENNLEIEQSKQRKKMLGIIQAVKSEELFVQNAKKIEFYKPEEVDFDRYIKRRKLSDKRKDIIAVLNDRDKSSDIDVIFTTSQVFILTRRNIFKIDYYSSYENISRDSSYEGKIVIGKHHYYDKRVNIDKLYELITNLKKEANKNNNETKNIADKIKQIMINADNREEEKES